jgi:hypothetical protein
MLTLLVGLIVATHPEASAGCDSVSYHSLGLMANVRAQVHSASWTFPGVNKDQLDTTSMRPVVNAALCRRALAAIQRYMNSDLHPTAIVLIRSGNYLVAEQVETGRGYDRTAQYFLDQSLHVLYPCPNGHPPPSSGRCLPRKSEP